MKFRTPSITCENCLITFKVIGETDHAVFDDEVQHCPFCGESICEEDIQDDESFDEDDD